MITIDQFKLLAHNLLPLPDQYTIVDRQRASANGFLLDPEAARNFKDLQHVKPTYQFVPKSVVARFRNISPGIFGVNRGQSPLRSSPFYAAFDAGIEPPDPATGTGEGHRDDGQPRGRRSRSSPPPTPKTDDTKPVTVDAGATQDKYAKPMTQEEYQASVIQAIKDLIPKPASSEGEPTTTADSTAATTTTQETVVPESTPIAETLGGSIRWPRRRREEGRDGARLRARSKRPRSRTRWDQPRSGSPSGEPAPSRPRAGCLRGNRRPPEWPIDRPKGRGGRAS